MYTYMATATTEDTPQERRPNQPRVSTGSNRDEHGFTEEWVRTHAQRGAQRQVEVRDMPSGTPRTQLIIEEEESE